MIIKILILKQGKKKCCPNNLKLENTVQAALYPSHMEGLMNIILYMGPLSCEGGVSLCVHSTIL